MQSYSSGRWTAKTSAAIAAFTLDVDCFPFLNRPPCLPVPPVECNFKRNDHLSDKIKFVDLKSKQLFKKKRGGHFASARF